MFKNTRKIFMSPCLTIIVGGLLTAQQMPRTTTQRVTTGSTTKSEQIAGTVVAVDGNTLAVRMTSGDLRTFTPPESRRFVVDGKGLTLGELKTGTKLTATITTTETSVTERTTTVGTGKVWFVAPPNVILTLPNGENRQYKVNKDYKFNIGGQPATVFELKKGMTVAAEKIVEVPKVELASNVTVTGTAPAPVAVAATPRPAQAPTAAASAAPARRSTPAPQQTASTPAPPTPAAAPSAPTAQVRPARLPATASPVPLIGLAGLLCGAASLYLRRLR